MLVKYIGPTQVLRGGSLNPKNTNDFPEINVEQNKEYDVDIQLDGPQMIINNVPVIHPDATLWVIFPNLGRVPYSKDCIKHHWEINL
jgi:hypothetical protein